MTDGPDLPRTPDAEPPDGPSAGQAPGGLPPEQPGAADVPLAGLDSERPLPEELKVRLEAALLAAVAGGLPVPADAESLDAPRPLPEALRVRLESALLAEAAAAPPAAAAASLSTTGGEQGSEAPTGTTGRTQGPGGSPAPAAAAAAGVSAGGDVVGLGSRRRKVVAWWSAVAAVLVLLLGVAGLASIGGQGGSGKVEVANPPTTATTETPASVPSDAGVPVQAPPATASGPASTATTRKPTRPSPTTTAPLPASQPTGTTGTTDPGPTTSLPGGGSPQAAPNESDRGPAPPFYDSTAGSGDAASPPAMTSGPSGGSGQQGAAPANDQKANSPRAATPAGPALRVGIVPGDPAQDAGFRAYINRLNQNGGVAGHLIELVNVGPGSPAAGTIATVNLGAGPVAGPGGTLPGWATGPLLETLTATENLLPANGGVFSFAGVPERQGHLAAEALFPGKVSSKTTAVIFVPPAAGPLRDVVPAAMTAVLEERGVTVKIEPYDPAADKPLPQSDAAFLSLDPAAAKAWVADARAANYRPVAGVAGIYSLADEALLTDLPEGARVVSPYVVPGGAEGQAIRSEAGGTSAPVLHGWATAKSLAAAVWRTGADSPAEVQAALAGLTGWSSGLNPAYETRPGTRSRTPEGVLLRVQSQAFIADGGFRRDTRSQPI